MDNNNGLTPAEIKQYQNDGYLVVEDVLSADEVKNLRLACDARGIKNILEEKEYTIKTVHLAEATVLIPSLLELASHPSIVKKIQSLLGDNIQLHHSKLTVKPSTPGAGPIAWHQDFAYLPHTNTDILAVMVMLDDATEENGCMQMVRCSHKHGLLNNPGHGLFTDSGEVSFERDPSENKDQWAGGSEVVSILPKAGGISIHDCLTVHASGVNLSGKPRRGIVFQYRAGDAYQIAGFVCKDTGTQILGERNLAIRCDVGIINIPKEATMPEYLSFENAWNQDPAE